MMLLYISFIKITFRINDFEILHLNNSTNLSTYDTAPRDSLFRTFHKFMKKKTL